MPFVVTALVSGLAGIVGYNYVTSEKAKADPVGSAINLTIVGITCFAAYKLVRKI